MIVDNYTCIGASHLGTWKPCQDASKHVHEDGLSIIMVSDGHGGDHYFRSDQGSRILTEVVELSVREFLSPEKAEKTKVLSLEGKPLCKVGVPYDGEANVCDEAMRKLFKVICQRWRKGILSHAEQTPVTPVETENVKPEYLADLESRSRLEKIYGCTLICYVQTPKFWFAFHIGDGKCLMFTEGGDCEEPVLWDPNCHLNRTTSICDSNAESEFRYTYCGDGTFPVAIFMGSDGIDDTYGDGLRLKEFYFDFLRTVCSKGNDSIVEKLKDFLPKLSAARSNDDMSVAWAVDEERSESAIRKYSKCLSEHYQNEASRGSEKSSELENSIDKLRAKVESLTGSVESSRKQIASFDDEIKKKESALASLEEVKKQKEADVLRLRQDVVNLKKYYDEAQDKCLKLESDLRDESKCAETFARLLKENPGSDSDKTEKMGKRLDNLDHFLSDELKRALKKTEDARGLQKEKLDGAERALKTQESLLLSSKNQIGIEQKALNDTIANKTSLASTLASDEKELQKLSLDLKYKTTDLNKSIEDTDRCQKKFEEYSKLTGEEDEEDNDIDEDLDSSDVMPTAPVDMESSSDDQPSNSESDEKN